LFSWWKAARPAVFTFNAGSGGAAPGAGAGHSAGAAAGGMVDFDWVRVVTAHPAN